MMARWALALATIVLLASGGCCCGPCGGGMACGNGCGSILPQPIVYPGSSDCEGCDSTLAWCRPAGGQGGWGGSCGSCSSHGSPCGGCGLLNFLRCRMTSCKGCGEMYYGEWMSDPPDCCDPCDACTGDFTGHSGCCGPGLLGRFWLGLSGGRNCGGACGCGDCGGGCNNCGGGHGMHGGQIMHGGQMMHGGPHSVLEENWDLQPGPQPIPGKPIHKAQSAPAKRVSHTAPAHSPAPRAKPITARPVQPVSVRMPALAR